MLQSLFSRVLGRLCTVMMIVVYMLFNMLFIVYTHSVQVHAVHFV